MTQQHLDRLTAVDASFLAQESPVSHMHVGAVTIFEGPPPTYEEITEALRARLHLVPRYRQKLAVAPLGARRPAAGHPPPAVGPPPRLQPRVPRPPVRAARPGLRGAAVQPRLARVLP